MNIHSSQAGKRYSFLIFRPESFLRRIVSAALVWAMLMSSLPAYPADQPLIQWVNHWDITTVPPANTAGSHLVRPAPTTSTLEAVQGQRHKPGLRATGMPIQVGADYRPVDLTNARASLSGGFSSALPLQGTSNSLLQVSVGFADSNSASANFPEPWNESNALVRFVGGGTSYRAGAIRLDNPTGSDISLDSVTVDLGRPGPLFQLWKSVVVPAFGSAILTQTANENFNSSASPITGCGQPLNANETRIPRITLTIGGSGTDYLDTAHVLDTGGFDSSCRGNQSLQWRPVGTTDVSSPAGSVQLIAENAPHAVGTQNTLTVAVNDAAAHPLANAPVILKVVNGPNAGKSFGGVTDATGNATLQYSSSVQGSELEY